MQLKKRLRISLAMAGQLNMPISHTLPAYSHTHTLRQHESSYAAFSRPTPAQPNPEGRAISIQPARCASQCQCRLPSRIDAAGPRHAKCTQESQRKSMRSIDTHASCLQLAINMQVQGGRALPSRPLLVCVWASTSQSRRAEIACLVGCLGVQPCLPPTGSS